MKKKLSKSLRPYAKDLIDWFCATNDIDAPVYVRLDRKSTKGCWGYCQKNSGYFVIVLNPDRSDGGKLLTIAHELVHIKQYYFSELSDDLTTWKGIKLWPRHKGKYYWSSPWEVEAEILEYKIFKEWLKS